MTTIIAVIFTVVTTYAAGIIALYVGHRMSHIPFHLDVFDIVFFAPLANVLWFFIICRLCHWTNDDIVGDDPYNQKMIQIKIERLLSMYDNMLGLIMTDKKENIKIFKHTQELIGKNKTLQDSVKYSVENSDFYADDMTRDFFCENKIPGIVKVTRNSSFNAARNYTGKVAVLNFASATNPGGGVTKGSNAQEECLCRCSTLYNVLSDPKFDEIFYKPHKEHGNALHNNDAIYTPDIQIIKSDNYNLLYRPFSVNVITCAAPNLRETPSNAYNHERGEKPNVTDEELFDIHFRRAAHILNLAAYHGDETIILGAFGCGAFKNPPEIVAKAYKKALERGKLFFKNIEFAVYCGKDDTNYKVFKEILE